MAIDVVDLIRIQSGDEYYKPGNVQSKSRKDVQRKMK